MSNRGPPASTESINRDRDIFNKISEEFYICSNCNNVPRIELKYISDKFCTQISCKCSTEDKEMPIDELGKASAEKSDLKRMAKNYSSYTITLES